MTPCGRREEGTERSGGATERSPQGVASMNIIARRAPFEPDSGISTREPPWGFCWNGTNTVSSASSSRGKSRSSDDCKNVLGRYDGFVPLFRYATVSSDESACVECGICCKYIQRVHAVCFRGMRKLRSVICLQNVRSVAEEFDCPFEEVHCGEATLFFIRVDEPIPRCFIYDGILVEFSSVFSGITRIWHIFHVHLPFFAEGCRRIVFAGMLDFFLCGFRFLPEPEADKYAV